MPIATSAREYVKNAILQEDSSFKVTAAAAAAPENLGADKVFVAVWRSALTSESSISLRHDLTIQVMTPITYAQKAEDVADAALDTVLLALTRLEGVYWTSAERAVFNETYIGYEIKAFLNTSETYLQTILGES